MDIRAFFLAFIPIFVAVDVVGALPLFVLITEKLDNRLRQKIINQSVLTALMIAVIFLFTGNMLFKFLGVSVADFLVAGGVLLFVLAINDLLKDKGEEKGNISSKYLGVVPLGTPIIAGPAVLATSIVMLDAYGLGVTLSSIVVNLGIVWLVFSFCDRLTNLLGKGGIEAISKISSLLLAAIAVMLVRKGIFKIFAG